jgi:hypothetical protein
MRMVIKTELGRIGNSPQNFYDDNMWIIGLLYPFNIHNVQRIEWVFGSFREELPWQILKSQKKQQFDDL